MFDLEPALAAAVLASGGQLERGARFGLGLTKQEPYDWRRVWPALVAVSPSVIIVLEGVWDARPVVVAGRELDVDSDAWRAWYRSLVSEALTSLRSTGATVVWLSTLPEAGPRKNDRIREVNLIAEAVVRATPGATWVDGAGVLTAASGEGPLRKPDGEHLCPTGAAALAGAAVDAAAGDLGAARESWQDGPWKHDSRYAGC